jgi:hypothetical protein
MKPDLSNTQVYRRWGLTGLRWFAWLWFPFVYAVLVGLGATIVWLLIFVPTQEGFWIGTIGGAVWIIGFAVLTKMYREFRGGIRMIESNRLG